MPGSFTHHYILYKALERFRSQDTSEFLKIPNFWAKYDHILQCSKTSNGHENYSQLSINGQENPCILPSFAYLGCFGPDLFYVGRLYWNYFIPDVNSDWEFLADLGHWSKTAPFMRNFLEKNKLLPIIDPINQYKRAFIAGYLSHIAADIVIHPYVNSIVRNYISNNKNFLLPRSALGTILYKKIGKFHTVLEDYQDAYLLYNKFYDELGFRHQNERDALIEDVGDGTSSVGFGGTYWHKDWRNINFSHAAAMYLKSRRSNLFFIELSRKFYKYGKGIAVAARQTEEGNYKFITNEQTLVNIGAYFEQRLPGRNSVNETPFMVQAPLFESYVDKAVEVTVQFWNEAKRYLEDAPNFNFNLMNRHWNLDTGFAPEITQLNDSFSPLDVEGNAISDVVINFPARLSYKNIHTEKMNDVNTNVVNAPQMTFDLVEFTGDDNSDSADRVISFGETINLSIRTVGFTQQPTDIKIKVNIINGRTATGHDSTQTGYLLIENPSFMANPDENEFTFMTPVEISRSWYSSISFLSNRLIIFPSIEVKAGGRTVRKTFDWDDTCCLYILKPSIERCVWKRGDAELAVDAVVRLGESFELYCKVINLLNVQPSEVEIKIKEDVTGFDRTLATIPAGNIVVSNDEITAGYILDRNLEFDWNEDRKIYCEFVIKLGEREMKKESNKLKISALRFEKWQFGETENRLADVNGNNAAYGGYAKCVIAVDTVVGISSSNVSVKIFEHDNLTGDDEMSLASNEVTLTIGSGAPPYTISYGFPIKRSWLDADSRKIYPQLVISGSAISHKFDDNKLEMSKPEFAGGGFSQSNLNGSGSIPFSITTSGMINGTRVKVQVYESKFGSDPRVSRNDVDCTVSDNQVSGSVPITSSALTGDWEGQRKFYIKAIASEFSGVDKDFEGNMLTVNCGERAN